jgi:predicted phage tail protein
MGIVNRSEDDVVVDSSLPSDALSSKQFATIVDVLSEGEIEGFPSAAAFTKGTANYNTAALKDVFLGKTPVLRASADPTNTQVTDFNFQDVEFEPRFGTSNQTFISGISDIESETNVGSKVENGTPISRQITNSNINAVRVTLRFNGLQTFETNGDVNGASVELTIKIIQNNGTTSTPISDTVTGRSSSAYNRDYRIDLPSNLNYPITVQVTRVTADATDPNRLRDEFFFQSFTEIIDEQRPYPDIAHLALRFDSEQFSSVPRRMYKVRGVKIKIPHNGTVDATTGRITYTNTFNGTLTTSKVWCSDPAWILFDLLTNVRYGLGDHITEAQLDKYAFYSASVYCSELVDDGAGGQEPRFSCNTILQARSDAYEVVNSLTSVMRSISFWTAGSLTISQDRPTDPSYLFNLSNVTSAGFGYSGTSLKTRATVVSVSYFDMENQELDFETVEDASAKAKYGVLHKKITGFGCSSRGQAARLGRFLLFEEQNSTETINFTTGLSEGVVVRPGQVIEVSDPVRAGLRRGGRIKSATTTTVTVDNTEDTDLDNTNNPTLSVILSDGSVETKPVSGISGAVITVSSAFSSAPNANSVWILSNTTLQTTQWRVVSVSEDKDNYAIIGTAYNSGKFAFIEDGSPLPVRNVTILNALKDAPAIDSAEQFFYVENQKAKVKIILDYQAVPGVSQYRVQYRKDNGNFVSTTVTGTDFTIFDASEGTYEFRVFSLNAALEASAEPSTLTKDFAGKTAIPADMTGLTAEPINNKLIRLKWNRSTDIDVTHGGLVYIRHDSSGTDGSGSFENAVDLIEAAPGNSTEAIVPAITGEYILKFQDDGGRFSAGEASVVVNIPEVSDELLVQTRREDLDNPKFQGAKVNTAFDATTNSLNLTGAGQFDDIGVSIGTSFDDPAIGSIDDIGGISPSGTYDFASTLDLGAVFSLDLIRHFKTEGFFPSDLFDARPQGFPTTGTFDGTEANDVDAQLFVRTTQDDPSGSPTYTAFQNFTSGTFKARGFQFRTVLTSNDPAQDIRVFELGYSAKLEKRIDQGTGQTITSSAGVTTVPFTSPFFVGTSALGNLNQHLPTVNVTAQNLASGDFFEISNITASNFQIHFKNSSNASISKQFTFTAVGFGKG